MGDERHEEERRYEEAGSTTFKVLDSSVLTNAVPVLRPKNAVTAARGDTVAEVVKRMSDNSAGCALVVDGDDLAGIFTERDALRRVLAAGRDPNTTTIGEVMTPEPERVSEADSLGFALQKMSVGSFRHLALVDEDGNPTGVVNQQDAVRYLVGFFPEEVINHPPQSILQNPHDSQYGG